MGKIASIVVNNTAKETDRVYDYIVPQTMEEAASVGVRVVVPFGKSNKYTEGYIVDLRDAGSCDNKKLKSIINVRADDFCFNKKMIELAWFLKKRYFCTIAEAFRTIMLSSANLKECIYIKLKSNYMLQDDKYKKITALLKTDRFTPLNDISKALNKPVKRNELVTMENAGIIEIKKEMQQDAKTKTEFVYGPADIIKCTEFIKDADKRDEKKAQVLQNIMDAGLELTSSEICRKFGCSAYTIKSLLKKELLIKKEVEVYRNPVNWNMHYEKFKLTADQINAIDKILDGYKKGRNIALIEGVTGCGKTEIYLNLVEKFISEDKDAIVLVPEISLTPQTVERFKGRFGDVVAVFHSRLSAGERYDEWRRIQKGAVRVVVGARSAIFAPLQNLKLIIIDEEHEYSYKSETSPKYLTSEVAEFLVNQNSGLLVMGSATPSIESYYKAETGKINFVHIGKRVDDRKLPDIKVIDMRDELKNGNKSMFSEELYDAVSENLKKKEQTLLFLNRRGFSTFVSCRSCGYVMKCKNCDVSLTYHADINRLKCHYCGNQIMVPSVCPKCGSKYIKYFGAGTEKIENEVKRLFPDARVLRMDMDTTRKKGAHEKIYNAFKEHKADILIGTQMISKGLDFKDVTLVGVIAADTSLNLPDFRSAERTFQLITQVSGRAGRGNLKGKVIVQTYEPEHYSIQYAKKQDYRAFYDKEIEIRKILNNPPFTDILYILFTSDKEESIIETCSTVKSDLEKISKEYNTEILGPVPCCLSKIKNTYRWHVIFKGNVREMVTSVDKILYRKCITHKVNYSMDINPYNML